MPPPKLAKPKLDRRRETLEKASDHTRTVNDVMDRIEENLDHMSYELKSRFRKLVSSQIGLLKYGEDGNNFKTRNINDNTHQEQVKSSDSHHDISKRMSLGSPDSSSSEMGGTERYASDISKRVRFVPVESSGSEIGISERYAPDISKRVRFGPVESSSSDMLGMESFASDISRRMRLGQTESSSSDMGGTETYLSDILKGVRLSPAERSRNDMGGTARNGSDISKRVRFGPVESSSSDMVGTEIFAPDISRRIRLGPAESSSSDMGGNETNSPCISKRMQMCPAESSSSDMGGTQSKSSYISKRMQTCPAESSSSDMGGTQSKSSYFSKQMQMCPAESSSSDVGGTELKSSYSSKRMHLCPAESSSSDMGGTESNSSYTSKRMQMGPAESSSRSSSSDKSGPESNSSNISKRMQLGPMESSSSNKSGTESNSSYISKRMQMGPADSSSRSSSSDKSATETNLSEISKRMRPGPLKSSSSDKSGTETNLSEISKRMRPGPMGSSSSDMCGTETNLSEISKRMHSGPAESSSTDKSVTETLSYISKRMQLGPVESSSSDKSGTESNSSYISKRMQLGPVESSSSNKSGPEILSNISKRMQLCPAESSSSELGGTERNSSDISKRMRFCPAESSSSDKSGTETLSNISKRTQLCPAESSSSDIGGTERIFSDISKRMQLGPVESSSSDLGGTERNSSDISKRMFFCPAESSISDIGITERNSSDILKRMQLGPAESSSSDIGITERNISDILKQMQLGPAESSSSNIRGTKKNSADISKRMQLGPAETSSSDKSVTETLSSISKRMRSCPAESSSSDLGVTETNTYDSNEQVLFDKYRPDTRVITNCPCNESEQNFEKEKKRNGTKETYSASISEKLDQKTLQHHINVENPPDNRSEILARNIDSNRAIPIKVIQGSAEITRESRTDIPHKKTSKDFYGEQNSISGKQLGKEDKNAHILVTTKPPKVPPKPPRKVKYLSNKEPFNDEEFAEREPMQNKVSKKARKSPVAIAEKDSGRRKSPVAIADKESGRRKSPVSIAEKETGRRKSPVAKADNDSGRREIKIEFPDRKQDPCATTTHDMPRHNVQARRPNIINTPIKLHVAFADERENITARKQGPECAPKPCRNRTLHYGNNEQNSLSNEQINGQERQAHQTKPEETWTAKPPVSFDDSDMGTIYAKDIVEGMKGPDDRTINVHKPYQTDFLQSDDSEQNYVPTKGIQSSPCGQIQRAKHHDTWPETSPVDIEDQPLKDTIYFDDIVGKIHDQHEQIQYADDITRLATMPKTSSAVINDEMKKNTTDVNDLAENWYGCETRGTNITKPHQSEYFNLGDREKEKYPMTKKAVRSPVSDPLQTVVNDDHFKHISTTLDSEDEPLYHLDTQEKPYCTNMTSASSLGHSESSDTIINTSPGITYSITTVPPPETIRYTHPGHSDGKTNDIQFTIIPTKDEVNNKGPTKKPVRSPVSKRLQTVVKQKRSCNKRRSPTLDSQEKSWYQLETQDWPYCRNKTTDSGPRHSVSSDSIRNNFPGVPYNYPTVPPSKTIRYRQHPTTGRNLSLSSPAILEDMYKVKPAAEPATRHQISERSFIPDDDHMETTFELIPNDSPAESMKIEDIESLSMISDENTDNLISFNEKPYTNLLVPSSPLSERRKPEFLKVKTSPIERTDILPDRFELTPEPETKQTLVNYVPLGEQSTVYYPLCLPGSSKQTFTDSSLDKSTIDTYLIDSYFTDGLATKYGSQVVDKKTKQAGFSSRNPKKKRLKISCEIKASPDSQKKIRKCVMKTTLKLNRYKTRARGNDKEDRQRRLKSPSLTDSDEEFDLGDIFKDNTNDRFVAKKSQEKRDEYIHTDIKGNNSRYSVNSQNFASSESFSFSDLERQTEIVQMTREARQNDVSCSVDSQILSSSKPSRSLDQERKTEIVHHAKETPNKHMSSTAGFQMSGLPEYEERAVDKDCQTEFLNWKNFESWFSDLTKEGSSDVSCDNLSLLGDDKYEQQGASVRFHKDPSRTETECEVIRPGWEYNSLQKEAKVNVVINDTQENATTRKDETKLTNLSNKYRLASDTTQEFEKVSDNKKGIDKTQENATPREIKEETKLTSLYNKYGLDSATTQEFEEFSGSDEGIDETKETAIMQRKEEIKLTTTLYNEHGLESTTTKEFEKVSDFKKEIGKTQENSTTHEIKEVTKLTTLYNKYGLDSTTKHEVSDNKNGVDETHENAKTHEITEVTKLANLYDKLASAATQEFEEFSDNKKGIDETQKNATTPEMKEVTKLTNLYNKYGLDAATTQEFEDSTDSDLGIEETKENAIMQEIKEELSKEVTNVFLINRWAKQEFETQTASTRKEFSDNNNVSYEERLSTKSEDRRTKFFTNRRGTIVESETTTRSETFWKRKRNVSFNTVFKTLAVFGVVVMMVVVFGPTLVDLLHRIALACIFFIWCNVSYTNIDPPVV